MLIWQESLRKSWSRQNSPGEISTALLGASIVHHFQRMTRGVSAWLGHIVSTLIVSTLTISVRRRERKHGKRNYAGAIANDGGAIRIEIDRRGGGKTPSRGQSFPQSNIGTPQAHYG